MTTEKNPEALRQMMLTQFREHVAELEAITDTTEIFAWKDIGLAVCLATNGAAYVGPIARAAPASEILYVIRNGHGDAAQRIQRDDAAACYRLQLQDLIADLEREA